MRLHEIKPNVPTTWPFNQKFSARSTVVGFGKRTEFLSIGEIWEKTVVLKQLQGFCAFISANNRHPIPLSCYQTRSYEIEQLAEQSLSTVVTYEWNGREVGGLFEKAAGLRGDCLTVAAVALSRRMRVSARFQLCCLRSHWQAHEILALPTTALIKSISCSSAPEMINYWNPKKRIVTNTKVIHRGAARASLSLAKLARTCGFFVQALQPFYIPCFVGWTLWLYLNPCNVFVTMRHCSLSLAVETFPANPRPNVAWNWQVVTCLGSRPTVDVTFAGRLRWDAICLNQRLPPPPRCS